MGDAIVVMTTFDRAEAAQEMANRLIERRLAACVQVIGPVLSTYRWEGKLENAREWLALIKTRAEHWPKIEQYMRERHGYETPEILAVPVAAVSEKYMGWLMSQTESG